MWKRKPSLSLVSRIANGKVETKQERDRYTALISRGHGATGREKMQPFLKRGLERFLKELAIKARVFRILDRVICKLQNDRLV